MKFKLVESQELHEDRTFLNLETRKHLVKEIKKLQLGDNYTTAARPGQTSLKKFLCALYGITSSKDITVHHINLDYTDYRPDNICLVKTREHNSAHNSCLTSAIEKVVQNKGILKKKDIHDLKDVDFSDEEISEIYYHYFESMQIWLQGNALDTGKITVS